MKKISKILIYFLILTVSIFLFFSIVKDYTAYIYLSEYKENLKQKKGNDERQGQLLRKSLRLCPSNAKTLFALGKFYIEETPIDKDSDAGAMSYAQSKEIFQKALMLKPTDGRKRAEYAMHIGSNGEISEAVEQFNMAINLCPTDAYPGKLYAMWCVDQVKKEIDLTNTDQLVEKYRNRQIQDETLKFYENCTINNVSIAALLDTAREEWDKVLSFRAIRHRHEYTSLADLNLLEFELDEAIQNYKRAKSKSMLARCFIIKGEYNRAINILARILKKDSKLSSSRVSKTKKLLMDVTNHDPENYQPFYWLGKLHTRLGETEQAISNFKTTIYLKPGHIDSHLNLAEIHNQTGKIDLAIKEYETILEKVPKHKEARRLLSEAVLNLKTPNL